MSNIEFPGREDLAIIIATLAFAVSFASFFVSWRTYSRDRGKLKILTIEYLGPMEKGRILGIHTVNVGRRDVILDYIGLSTRTGEKIGHKPYRATAQNEIRLSEGDRQVLWFYATSLSQFKLSDTVMAEVKDTLGNRVIYKFPRSLRKRLKTDAKIIDNLPSQESIY